MKLKKTLLISAIFLIMLLPFVSAWSYSYYDFTPSELLENEWVVFGGIFLLVFAITFFALGKTMKESIGAKVVISLVVALFIASAISQRTRFYAFAGEEIGGWLVTIAILLGIVLLIKLLTGIIGGIGLFIALFGAWFVFSSIDPYDILPYGLLGTNFSAVYEFIASTLFLIILIIIVVAILAIIYSGEESDTKKKMKKWFWGSKKKREIKIPID